MKDKFAQLSQEMQHLVSPHPKAGEAQISRAHPHIPDPIADAQIASEPTSPAFLQACRIIEALLFASATPLSAAEMQRVLPAGQDVLATLAYLRAQYAGRGVDLVKVAEKWCFRTAPDLGWLISGEKQEPKKLSKAALETLSIIAYHQPVTRAEIEQIRGVQSGRGTLDLLLETGWIRMRGRRKSIGRPVTYGTSEAFLIHFGLDRIADLPGLDELKGAGFITTKLPVGFQIPLPNDDPALGPDEDALPEDLMETIAEARRDEEIEALEEDS